MHKLTEKYQWGCENVVSLIIVDDRTSNKIYNGIIIKISTIFRPKNNMTNYTKLNTNHHT